jgi:hypothetical protein
VTTEKLLRSFWILFWWGVVLYLNRYNLWHALAIGLGIVHFHAMGYAQGRRDAQRES